MKQIRIIPEPHIRDNNFTTRTDYLMEIKSYMDRIMNDVQRLVSIMSESDELYLVFVGDIFDIALRSLDVTIDWLNYFSQLNDLSKGNLFATVGNHEITYRYRNPFWMIAANNSEWLHNANILDANSKTIMPMFQIVDELIVDNLMLIFGHYKRDISFYTDAWISEHYPEVTEVVVVSHNEILNASIHKYFKDTANVDLTFHRGCFTDYAAAGYIPPTSKLTKVYVGHMHSAYGTRHIKENIRGIECDFDLQYLASLGRTNVTEVRNNFLERMIPTIVLDTGEIEYGNIPFQLVGEEVIVDTRQLAIRREQYNASSEMRALRETNLQITDPAEDLKKLFGDNNKFRTYFACAVSGTLPSELTELLMRADQIIGGH